MYMSGSTLHIARYIRELYLRAPVNIVPIFVLRVNTCRYSRYLGSKSIRLRRVRRRLLEPRSMQLPPQPTQLLHLLPHSDDLRR